MESVKSFQARSEKFFQHFKSVCTGMSTSRKPHLHILREHAGVFIEVWAEIGYRDMAFLIAIEVSILTNA